MEEDRIDFDRGMSTMLIQDTQFRRRGRGFGMHDVVEADGVKSQGFEQLDVEMTNEEDAQNLANESDVKPAKSMEGWVIVVANIHEEALEDDVMDVFAEYGKVQDLHLNLDRRTGYVKGYALVQYKTQQEAQSAINACKQGLTLLEQSLDADYAFVQPPTTSFSHAPHSRRSARDRSLSPMR